MKPEAFIIDGIRTAVGKFGGSLSNIRTDDLAAMPIRYLMEKYEFLKHETDDVILGCANQAGEDNRNVARMALLLAGLDYSVPGETVNRLCASGMSSIIHGKRAVLAGDADLIIAGGVENMTRGPYVLSKSTRPFGNDSKLYDSSFGWRFVNPRMFEMYGTDAMGVTAENLADKFGISREDQDAFAFWSQMKVKEAKERGRLTMEIMNVKVPIGKKEWADFNDDEFSRPDTTLQVLSGLRPAFKKEGGSVTAGNSSGLNDGAAAVIVGSEAALKRFNLQPLCRIVSSGVAGVEPRIMGIGPVEASKIALKKAGLSMDDMDIIELNEAFAVQVLSCLKEFKLDFDDKRINPNGGAISIGHPLGMSGTRIVHSAALELKLTGKKYALVTMCIGVGQGYAVIIENTNL